MTVAQTAAFPTAAEGYDRATVDAAFEAERHWRQVLEQRTEVLLREAAALHLAIATHSVDPVDEPARLVAAEVVAAPTVTDEEPTPRQAAAERRKTAAAAKKEAALAEELQARQAAEKRQAAAERRKAAAAAKKAAQEQDAAELAVLDEIKRATAEVAAMKAELELLKTRHAELPAVPSQGESTRTVVPPAAAAFAASAGAAWARRTTESTTVRRAESEKPRPAKAPAPAVAPASVSIPLVPAAPTVEGTLQEVPAARNGGRFGKRIVLRKPVNAQPEAPVAGDRVESRVIRLG